MAAALIAGAAAAGIGIGHFGLPGPATTQATASGGGRGSVSDTGSIAAKVDPGLVDVNTVFGYQQARGAGTGMVLTPTGEVLTNNHVIDGATSISVTDIGNGRTYSARVVGYDTAADIAVLQLQGASGLATAPVSASAHPTVGESVVAIGNAGGVGGVPTASAGNVTALHQAITASDELDGTSEHLSGLIETSADVQSGDSGGPLVDSSGQVIGMDTAASNGLMLQSASGTQGYAIPIGAALGTAHQIESGSSSASVHVGPTAFLGVLLSGGTSGAGFAPQGGALVSGVVPGSAAARAGLAAGDTITGVNGEAASSPSSIASVLAGTRPGQSVTVTWTGTGGLAHSATVALGSGPPA